MAQSGEETSLRPHSRKESLGPPPNLSMPSNLCLAPLCTGGKGYGQESGEEDFKAFRAWLRCYGVVGMSSLRDRHGRTIWFQVRALTVRQTPRGWV